jgi:hypothetical protein
MIRKNNYSKVAELLKKAQDSEQIQNIKDQRILSQFTQEEDIPAILYHGTTAEPEQIKQQGLLKSYQNDIKIQAVYFFKTEINARHILNQIVSVNNRDDKKKYIVKVSSKNLENFYQDPRSLGILTTQNVPAENILDISPVEETQKYQEEKQLQKEVYPFNLQGIDDDPTSYNLVFPDDSEIYGKVDSAKKSVTINDFQWISEDPEMFDSYDPEKFKKDLESIGYSVFIS